MAGKIAGMSVQVYEGDGYPTPKTVKTPPRLWMVMAKYLGREWVAEVNPSKSRGYHFIKPNIEQQDKILLYRREAVELKDLINSVAHDKGRITNVRIVKA